jgi:uncharacterized protein YjbI with pentapeptide repeats
MKLKLFSILILNLILIPNSKADLINPNAKCKFNQNSLNNHGTFYNCKITKIAKGADLSNSTFVDSDITLTNANNINFFNTTWKGYCNIRLYGESSNIYFGKNIFLSTFIFINTTSKYNLNAAKLYTPYGVSFEQSIFKGADVSAIDLKSSNFNYSNFYNGVVRIRNTGILSWTFSTLRNTTMYEGGIYSKFPAGGTNYFFGTKLINTDWTGTEVTAIKESQFNKIQEIYMEQTYKMVNGKKVFVKWKNKN